MCKKSSLNGRVHMDNILACYCEASIIYCEADEFGGGCFKSCGFEVIERDVMSDSEKRGRDTLSYIKTVISACRYSSLCTDCG